MRYCCLLLLFFFVSFTRAQDIHFSQMKFSPLMVNPAFAGLNGKYNAIANYRSQWNSVSAPFTTIGASFDMNFSTTNNNKGFLAGGINLFHDIAGDMKMTSSNVGLNLAYHLRTGRSSTIGLGIQGGYSSRGIGNVNGFYGSQYNGTIIDQSLPSGENFNRTNFGYVDLGSGIVFKHNSLSENTFNYGGYSLATGMAAYHITRPKYSFLQGGNEDLSMRLAAFVEVEFLLNDRWGMMPALYYQRQGAHQEIYFGTYIKYKIIKRSNITGLVDGLYLAYGPFYRVNDAFVNKLLIDYKGYALGISYDVNLSSLTHASKGRGGVEFMFRYTLSTDQQTRSRFK